MRFFYKMKKGKLTVLGWKPRVSELPCNPGWVLKECREPALTGGFRFNSGVDEGAFAHIFKEESIFKRRKNPAIYLLGRRNGTLDPSLYDFLAHLIFTL